MNLKKFRLILTWKSHTQEYVIEAGGYLGALRRWEAQYGPRRSRVLDYSVVELQ